MANLRAGTTVGGDAVFTVGNISSYGLNFLNGNIGIGTDSPDFLLDLEQKDGGVQLQMGRTNTSAGSAWMGADSTGFHLGVGTYTGIQNSAFTIDSNGNVGIGTTSPDYKLDIQGDSNQASKITLTRTDVGRTAVLSANSDSPACPFVGSQSDNDFAIHTNGSAKMLIDTDGNVGIGTTDPKSKLHIGNDADASNWLKFESKHGSFSIGMGEHTGLDPEPDEKYFSIFDTEGASHVLHIRDTGNIGIGTVYPGDYRLNVNGSTNVQGTLYTNALYDNGNANVHAGNIATYLPDHNHNASEITAGTLSSARIPAATADNLGGVKVSYNAASQTLNITTS